jgi:FeS assembly SUF system regulator
MIRIAKYTDYATLLLTQLAKSPDRQVSAQQLAKETELPPPTVARLLKLLTRADLVSGQRGTAGGYKLSRSPREISIAEVITAIEGPCALTDCAQAEGNCGLEPSCLTKVNWRAINHAVAALLDAVSLADMARPCLSKKPPSIARNLGKGVKQA